MQPDSRLSTLPIPLCSVHPWCQKVKALSANRWKHLASAQMLAFTYKLYCHVPRMRVFTHAKSREGLYGARASVQFLLGFQQTKHSRPSEHIYPMIVAGKHTLRLYYGRL